MPAGPRPCPTAPAGGSTGTTTTSAGPGPGAGNVISGNAAWGILLQNGTTSDLVKGNYVGTDVTGATVVANGAGGIEVSGAVENIGGNGANEGNLISGNTGDGLFVTGAGANAST